jgi:hypothetical protein
MIVGVDDEDGCIRTELVKVGSARSNGQSQHNNAAAAGTTDAGLGWTHFTPQAFLELRIHVSDFSTMTRDIRHSSLLKGLLCLLAIQLPLVDAQVADIEKATNASLLWGPYRPNLYFGVRPRIPKSLMGGLLWTRVEDYSSVQNSKCVPELN